MIDYSLWEVIENSNAPPITKVVEGVETMIAPTTAKEKYENFTASSSEVLDQTFDRLQNIISQLEIHGDTISQEDMNQKFLKSLSPEWNTHTIVWRNKPEIDTLSLDDHYKNLKIYKPKVRGTSSSSTNTQNVAFVSVNSIINTNRAVNTSHGATTTSTQVAAINLTTINNLCLEFIEARLLVYKKNESVYAEDIKIVDKRKTGLGYNAVPPPYTGNFMPLKPDLLFFGLEEFVNEPLVSEPTIKKLVIKTSEAKTSANKPQVVR
nr:hypothetical protein [Tanacetum cinerariifolium]